MSDLLELVKFLRDSKDLVKKTTAISLLKTMSVAHQEALKNAKKQFKGRNNRRLSGQLFNSIFTEVKIEQGQPTGFIGTRNIPYGRIHELGGEIKPRPENKMQRLWIPVHANLPRRRMTPREFIAEKRRDPRGYFLNDKVAGEYHGPRGVTPYFWLVERAEIPKRPYIVPAVETAFKDFDNIFMTTFEKEAAK